MLLLFVCISRASVKPRFSEENKLLDADEDDAEDNSNVDDDVNSNSNNNRKNNNMDKNFDFVFFLCKEDTQDTPLRAHY